MSSKAKETIKGCVSLAVLAILVSWVVVGCAQTDKAGRSVPSPRPGPSAQELAYLSALHGTGYDWSTFGDSQLVDVGRTTCEGLDKGLDPGAVAAAGERILGLDTLPMAYLEGAAIGAFCPQNSGSVL